MESTVVWYDQSGKASAQFSVQGMIFASAALSGRRLAVLDLGSSATVYDASGKVISTISQNDIIGLAASADGLYLMKRGEIAQLDAEFGTIRSIPFTSNNNSHMMASPDGTLYVLTAEGIFSAGAQDTEFTKKSDVSRFLLGAPDADLSGSCALNDGTIITRFGGGGMTISTSGRGASVKVGKDAPDEEETRMVAYVYDAAIDTSSIADFTISALRDSYVLRKVVNDFQRAHPELNVHFDPFLSEDDMETPVDDAIRTLNTNLLAGKAGDVILLDELPIAQYISKGVLAPLDDIVKDIGFLPGILAGSQFKDGHIYAMPAQFAFETLWGAKAKIAGISTLDDLSGLPLDNAQELLYPRTPEELLKLFYPAAQASFVDENGKIQLDSPAFASFLEALYQIYSNESSAPDESGDQLYLRKMPMRPEEMQSMLNNAIAVAPARIGDTMQISLPYTVSGAENSLCIPVPSLSGASDNYMPSLLAGINAQTTQRGFAEEFLRLLYSPEVQELDQGGGLPTVAASLDALVQKAKELSKNKNVSMMMSTGTGNPIQMKQPDEATWDQLRAMCDTLKTPYIADAQLMSFMVEETASFFSGQGTAQDAARAIAERAGAYLNER
jgi:ABC-type glycerol-3-phosphate transport system substrate-binding protein